MTVKNDYVEAGYDPINTDSLWQALEDHMNKYHNEKNKEEEAPRYISDKEKAAEEIKAEEEAAEAENDPGTPEQRGEPEG